MFRTLALVARLRRDAEAVLASQHDEASRLFHAAWEAYRPNIPHYDWSGHLGVSADELESLHWILFFTSFMAAWWVLQGERQGRESIRNTCAGILTRLGCMEDSFVVQLDLLEGIFVAYLRGRSVPSDVVKQLCELIYH